MHTVRSASVVGMTVQLAVLAALWVTAGLSLIGLLVGVAFGAAVVGLLARGLRRAGSPGPSPADRVTLGRSALVGGIGALAAESLVHPVPSGATVGLAAAALLLDAVDGRVARATGTVSVVGARFDVEVDAMLVLLLSVAVARDLGSWVVLLGTPHYALAGARLVLPWLRRPAPPRFWCKVVAAVQGVVLVVAASGLLPPVVAVGALLGVAALLTESFGREVAWLWRTRPSVAALPALGSVRG